VSLLLHWIPSFLGFATKQIGSDYGKGVKPGWYELEFLAFVTTIARRDLMNCWTETRQADA
jgi:hypothetical protein